MSKKTNKLLGTSFNYRDKLFLLFAFVFSATLGFLFYKNLAETSAVHAAYNGFSAGNIINDAVMSDFNSMSEADIQNFLKSKNPCNDTNLSKADGYWHLNYHVENGHFVCMADERFDGESAAHIIWQAAHDYRINPRVLIVLLQKEQGLVTDTWPNFNLQYRSATGYGCPDTAACDSQYYGFRNQVRNAAELFRYILDHGSSYYPVGNRSIKYNPNNACGSSVVNIENRATSALYQYTPYQPNNDVLNAGPGVVVNCGAYGNINFYYYYTQWFGDTRGKELSGITLADGIYQFKSTDGLTLSFDGEGNGAAAKLTWPNSNDTIQQFRISRSGKYYRFQNVRTGKFLDVSGAVANDGTKVNLWDSNDSCAQKWLVQDNGTGYRLISACASEAATKSLDISGVATGTVGANVQSWSSNDSNAQRWMFNNISSAPIDSGTYALTSTSGKVLTPSSESPSNGTSMIIWENSTSAVNRFKITRRDDGFYRLQNIKTGQSLDVDGGETKDGSKVQLWSNNDFCAQKWIAEKAGDYYNFRNACSGKSLDIEGVATGTNNTKVQLWSNNTSNAQKWSLTTPIEKPIENGVYSFDSVVGNGQRLDVDGGQINRDGGNLQLWSRNGSDNQKFELTYNKDSGYYSIKNIAAKRNIDVTGFGVTGGNLQVTGANNGCYQQWILVPVSNNQYYLASACTRNVFDTVGGGSQTGTNVDVWPVHGGANQRWLINSDTGTAKGPIEDGNYYITSGLGNNLALDIAGAGVFDGANMTIWTLHKGWNQQFRLITDPATGNYSIYSVGSRRYVDSAGAIARNANNVWTWSGNSTCAQKWKLTSMGSDYYRIASTCNTNFSLDVEAVNSTPGTNVYLWTNHNGANQKWRFTKV